MRDERYQAWLERIKADSDIVSVISGYTKLDRRGRTYWGCCPFHQEKTPSFSVSPEKGLFYCFGCQAGGDVVSFLMKVNNLTFMEAAKKLSEQLHIPVPERERTPREQAREKQLAKIREANELAARFFHACLEKTAQGQSMKRYLEDRGVNEETCEQFMLGASLERWDALFQALLKRGVEPAVMEAAGLIVKRDQGRYYDRFRSRVMFPIRDAHGRVVGFGGRAMGEAQPKYLNTGETEWFNKRQLLYALDVALPEIRKLRQAIVVEGYMDAISLQAAGLQQTVASLGTAFSEQQARLLAKITDEVFFAYDSDAAGQKATSRALEIAKSVGIKARVLLLPDGKDPDEYVRNHGAEAMRALVARAVTPLSFHIERIVKQASLSTLAGKIEAVSNILPFLADTDSAVEVAEQVRQLANRLAVDEGVIQSELQAFLRKSGVRSSLAGIGVPRRMKVEAAWVEAERQLLLLMLHDPGVTPYLAAELPEGFVDEDRSTIFHLLCEKQLQGERPSGESLVGLLPEKAGAELARILVSDYVPPDELMKTVEDLLRQVQRARLEQRYEQHRLRADEFERMGDSRFLQELAESQRIKDEIKRLLG